MVMVCGGGGGGVNVGECDGDAGHGDNGGDVDGVWWGDISPPHVVLGGEG